MLVIIGKIKEMMRNNTSILLGNLSNEMCETGVILIRFKRKKVVVRYKTNVITGIENFKTLYDTPNSDWAKYIK